MKLTFLGTSHGLPEAHRHCTCTMLEIGDAVYLIDAGAPVADLLVEQGIPYSRIRAIFTTHMHGDHTFGMIPLLSLCSWYGGYADASFDVFLAEEVGMHAIREVIRAADAPIDESRIHLKKTEPGVIYSDDALTVTAVPTRHMGDSRPSFALILETRDEKRVIFTGDLRGDAADFPAEAKNLPSDALICEAAHFPHDTIFPHLAACPTRQIFIHHIGLRRATTVPAIEAANESGSLGCPICAVNDGDSFLI